jgi:DNA repair protein RecN (Recombination protein N)
VLLSININNYTLVESLEIEFSGGTTAITGETGAGKSLVLDALGMALGDRADTGTIRHGKDRAEITATFAIDTIEDAKAWLSNHDFSADGECILRRIYTVEGRSRGYINGQSCTMQQLQQLGDMLSDIPMLLTWPHRLQVTLETGMPHTKNSPDYLSALMN